MNIRRISIIFITILLSSLNITLQRIRISHVLWDSVLSLEGLQKFLLPVFYLILTSLGSSISVDSSGAKEVSRYCTPGKPTLDDNAEIQILDNNETIFFSYDVIFIVRSKYSEVIWIYYMCNYRKAIKLSVLDGMLINNLETRVYIGFPFLIRRSSTSSLLVSLLTF